MQKTDPDGFTYLDLLFDDEDLAGEPSLTIADVEAVFDGGEPQEPSTELNAVPSPANPGNAPEDGHASYTKCLEDLSCIFPDICSEYVRGLFDTWMQVRRYGQNSDQIHDACHDLTVQILDASSYPKEKDRIKELKRKRSQALNSDEEEELKWKDARKGEGMESYMDAARSALQAEFVSTPVKVIDSKIRGKGSYYAAYLELAKTEWEWAHTGETPYLRLKHCRKTQPNAPYHSRPGSDNYTRAKLEPEIQAAKDRNSKVQAIRKAQWDAAKAADAFEQTQRDNGDVLECQCCYEEFPINKVTHCDGDLPHFFCLECARKNANNEVGNLRYKLTCMSGDVCDASFSRTERRRFLDDKCLEALERIQQQAELKQAGLDGLTGCPFCDFAAICPPVEIDKEFQCRNTDCEKVSCRICKLESHVPMSCDEWKRENRISERHILEEARTAALLKKCPKCQVQIIKERGCNKLTCPCGGIMCDFCGKDITDIGYGHFKWELDGGKNKCPTYDNFDARREKAVGDAEADAIKKVRARNPDLNPEDLNIKFTEHVGSAKANPLKSDHGGYHPNNDPLPPVGNLADGARALARPARPPPAAAAPLRAAMHPLPAGELEYLLLSRGQNGHDGGMGFQGDRALAPPVRPPAQPAPAPAIYNSVNDRIRHRPPHANLPAELVQAPFEANPAIGEGLAAALQHAYQRPSHLPAIGPMPFYRYYPGRLPEPPPGLYNHPSFLERRDFEWDPEKKTRVTPGSSKKP